MISINFFALVYTILEPELSPRLPWFIALEGFITAMLVFELMIRVMAEGRSFLLHLPVFRFWGFATILIVFLMLSSFQFFRSKSNLFDLGIALLCVSSLVMFVCLPTLTEYIEEDIALILRCIRDLLRLIRLIFLFKRWLANMRHFILWRLHCK